MELRKDYILDRYVVISELRAFRPNDFVRGPALQNGTVCFFCPGNESMTTLEKGRIGEPWRIRWFENKFPALSPEGKHNILTDNAFFTYSDAFGYHEVIVETNHHELQLSDLADFDVKDILKIYKNRIEELSAKPYIEYVLIFKNHGKDAGTSVKHSHTQVAALNHVPRAVSEKLAAVSGHDSCPYCQILNIEKNSLRRCYENSSFVAFTPYASRFNFEVWIFPKKHYLSITQLDDWEMLELAQIMKAVLLKLKAMDASYNMIVHNSPQSFLMHPPQQGLHFHIEICPRLSTWAGFEIGSEVIINSVSPETAARYYRGEE